MIKMKNIEGFGGLLFCVKELSANGAVEINEGSVTAHGCVNVVIDDVNNVDFVEVESKKDAWDITNVLFPTDYEKDEGSSLKAGYSIYRSTAENGYYNYICDLNTRLEINLKSGKTINVWYKRAGVECEKV